MTFQIEITILVELPYDADQYPEGMSPQDALALELEAASRGARELLSMQSEVVKVRGQVVDDTPPPLVTRGDRITRRATH